MGKTEAEELTDLDRVSHTKRLMTLGNLITRLFKPCTNVPKSPEPGDGKPSPKKEKQIVEVNVTPCVDISNKDLVGTPSPAAGKEKVVEKEDKPPSSSAEETPQETATPASPKKANAEITEIANDESERLILKVFGFDVLHQLQGKTWDERGQGVQAVRTKIAQGDMGSVGVEDFFHAGCCVSRMALKDKVMPVFFDGLDLCKLLLGDFVVKQEVSQYKITGAIDMLVPIIVEKTSDRNARSIEGTRQALIFLARQPSVGCRPVQAHILTPIANLKDVAGIRGRLELITHVIDEFGFSKTSGMSLSSTMGFVRPHLDAPDEKVRRAAVEVTVGCYSLKGERTLKFCSNLKPALLKLLEQRFAEVNNVKTGAKKAPTNGLPEVRGTKMRKSKPAARHNESSGSSRTGSSGSVNRPRNTAPLAPLAMSNRGQDAEEAALHADIFAPCADVTISPAIRGAPFDSNLAPQMFDSALIDDQNTSSMMRTGADPNYIPSPTQPGEDPFGFDGDDQAFMDEIEGF